MTAALHTAAARNNAAWCAAMCRSHSIPNTFSESMWRSSRRPPRYYPDAVSLRPGTTPAGLLPANSIKDSFADLDLTPYGYAELFTAQWIHRPVGLLAPPGPALRADRVATATELRDWQTAWHGGDTAPDIFRPALLDDPSVLVLAVHDGDRLAGGAVLNHDAGVAGLSNLFTTGADIAAVRSSAITAATMRFPGLPLVGYERGDDLEIAYACGFRPLGPLRVWLRE